MAKKTKGNENIAACQYRVRKGKEKAFRAMLVKHYKTMCKLGLIDQKTPMRTYEGVDGSGGPIFIEFLPWAAADSAGRAHELPAVMAVWEPMEKMCESRNGLPAMMFPHVKEIFLHGKTK